MFLIKSAIIVGLAFSSNSFSSYCDAKFKAGPFENVLVNVFLFFVEYRGIH